MEGRDLPPKYEKVDANRKRKGGASTANAEAFCRVIETWVEAGDFLRAENAFSEMINAKISPQVSQLMQLLSLADMSKAGGLRRMIFKYLISKDVLVAHDHFQRVQALQEDRWTYNPLISGLFRAGAREQGLALYRAGTQIGVRFDRDVYNFVIAALCNANLFGAALDALKKSGSVRLHLTTYTTLVKACVLYGTADEFVHIRNQLKTNEVKPDVFLYTSLIDGCYTFSDPAGGLGLFEELIDRGLTPDLHLYTKLLSIYSAPPFEDPSKCIMWYESMILAGHRPTLQIFTNMLSMYARRGNPYAAETLYQEMLDEGLEVDGMVMTTLISAYATVGDSANAARWCRMMLDRGFMPDMYVYHAVMRAYVKSGDLELATGVYRELLAKHQTLIASGIDSSNSSETGGPVKSRPTAAIFNTLIADAIRSGRPVLAGTFMKEMMSLGIPPDTYTTVAFLQHFISERDVNGALHCFKHMIDSGVKPNNHVYSALLTAIAKSRTDRKTIDAVVHHMHEQMIQMDAHTLTCLMRAYMVAEEPAEVVALWEDINPLGNQSTDGQQASGPGKVPNVDESLTSTYIEALVRLHRHAHPSDAEWLERLTSAMRAIIDSGSPVNRASWKIVVQILMDKNKAAIAASLLTRALENCPHDLAAESCEPVQSNNTRTTSHYTDVLRRMRLPLSTAAHVASTAAGAIKPSVILSLVLALQETGQADWVQKLYEVYIRLSEAYPADRNLQKVLVVLTEATSNGKTEIPDECR
ncbi:hypothetical protein HDU85_002061 [Gaertneriomyces sp. JEL0708]|nr:hypothetical protein HDU85_002061 [Gaertneriomyces sp. JEL0708]